jgi:hypothetical protein
MTDPTTLLALADRCEQAAGPDRELDVAIAFACGIVTHRQGDCFYTKNRYCPVMVLEYDYDDTEYRLPELPSYTASLDAAVTLYPVLPEVISSCPRKASAAALRARAAAHE